jgi:hypothetical protein
MPMTTLLSLALAALLSGDPDAPRKPNPLAPSLPLLTDEEEDRLDAVIDRFIDADIGRLTGTEAKKAVRDFEKLSSEAIPALIRGLNRAAKIQGSCPAVVIAQKLERMLAATEDRELLEFARENIGAGVGRTRHAPLLQRLRVLCMLRNGELARRGPSGAGPSEGRSLRTLSVRELAAAAGSERGPRLKAVLTELGRRRGDEALAALGTAAAASYDKDVQDLARGLLLRSLGREGAPVVKDKLKDDRAEVRIAAAKTAGQKGLHVEGELIEALADEDGGVREAARQALVRLSKGADYGPAPNAGKDERAEAVKKWSAWWAQQPKR